VLYSDNLLEFTGVLENTRLIFSLDGLARFVKKPLSILSWDEDNIAIPIEVSVELPPLGNYEGIDIRSIEPILIVINYKNYPAQAPHVYPNRINFPKKQLAHLYVARKGKPPGFCFVRGNRDDWYSNKQLKDLLIRIGNWLRDAATGELTEDGNQYDPIRLEGYSGTIIYDYDSLFSTVSKKESYFPETNFAAVFLQREIVDENLKFTINRIITLQNINETYEEFKKEKEKESSIITKKHYHFGYIVWSRNDEVIAGYSVDLPYDWDSLVEFCRQNGVELDQLEGHIATNDLNTYLMIPVIVAIRRPKNIIGFSGDIEFFNFYLRIDSGDVADGKIINSVPVKFQKHSQPLTRKMAKRVSGFYAKLDKLSLVVGCGALGSKITMHLARSGSTRFIIADPDELSPHNLVRHAAFANQVGINKAVGMRDAIKSIYPNEDTSLLFGVSKKGEDVLSPDLLKAFGFIFDFSASNSFFQSLILAETNEDTKICKAYLTDFGNLGVLFFEGKNRNPRVDDLQVLLYAQCRNSKLISNWLERELNSSEKNIDLKIGVGCNSETIVLADDIVSLHGSFFSGVIKTESQLDQKGKIYLNEIRFEPFFSNFPQAIEIAPLVVLHAVNDPTWEIRFLASIIESVKNEMSKAKPLETGGVFVGCANYKTKVIHVVELIKAPSDSQANGVCFFRGINGLSNSINEINVLSGNQIGYIGEWHSHPNGPEEMSYTDMKTASKFKTEFEAMPTPLPVFLMIVTSNNISPYVF